MRIVTAPLKQAAALHLIPTDPTIGVRLPNRSNVKKPSKAILAYTPDEQFSLCWVLESYRRRGYAILLFMLETGLRAGEALALRWDDVNFEGKRLRVHYYTSVDAGTQAQFLQDTVAANADLLLVSLADAASAAEFSQTLSVAEIPVLYFNAEPKAEAVSTYDAIFVGSKNGTRPDSAALGKACAEIALNRLQSGQWLAGTEYTSANGWSVLLDPYYRLTGLKIGIDPGHQRKTNYGKEPISPGSSTKKTKVSSGTYGVVTKTSEYVRVLEISKKLRKTLEALGAEVYMTRETHDVNISNVQRAKMMNQLGVDLVLRIHCDGSSARDANGISLYVRKSGTKAKESLAAANAILPAMIRATGANRRGVKRSNDYTGLNWSTVPCILVECGFMTNPDEDRLLAKSAYQQKLADGMTNGICKYFGR